MTIDSHIEKEIMSDEYIAKGMRTRCRCMTGNYQE